MTSYPFAGSLPIVDDTAWIAPNATLIGRVSISPLASVFYGAVLRGDTNSIVLGARSNLQDNVVVHGDEGFGTVIGEGVSVGHGAVLHGCTIGNDTLIGMNATVLNGAVIGTGCLIAAGAVILEGTVIPPGSLVAGVPGKVRRELTDDERAHVRENATGYLRLAAGHAEAQAGK